MASSNCSKYVPSSKDWPLFLVILMSWGVALFEYSFMIPANRIGAMQNGGPFNLIQLKVIQEAVSLTVFTIIVITVFKTVNFPLESCHFIPIHHPCRVFLPLKSRFLLRKT
jgi:Uncharacterized protein conserved in bacteria